MKPPDNTKIKGSYIAPSRWAIILERLALTIERPLNRLIGNTQLNPFYHTGAIASFLLAVVAITGFYLFLFYQYGFTASYEAVVTRIETPFLARIIRAIHKYASGALVITTLLHAYRMLFMERFRGPRWLAWMTGIIMTFILWLGGITGYALIWDSRAQLINEHFASFLGQVTNWMPAYRLALLHAELNNTSWRIMLILLALHVLTLLVVAGFFWFHVRHLRQVRWLPEMTWILGAGAVLLVVSALFPAGILPPANPNQLPDTVLLDPIFLYYLPLTGSPWANLLWAFMWLATAVALVLPWLRTKKTPPTPTITILNDQCTGCTKCATDCPYNAIEMVPRHDDSGHQLLAIAYPDKCVGCGICVGSCDDFFAIQLGETSPNALQQQLTTQVTTLKAQHPDKDIKVILTCKRHAAHGAQPYLNGHIQDDLLVTVFPLICSGAVPPSILPQALTAGASEVEVVGCPPYDCAHRLGNMLEEQRVTHERVPRLRKRFDDAPITAAWIPPDEFAQALPATSPPIPTTDDAGNSPTYLSRRTMFQWLTGRNLMVGFVLLAIVMISQIWLTGLPFTPYSNPPARIQITLGNPAARLLQGQGTVFYGQVPRTSTDLVTLILEIDGQVTFTHDYPAHDFFTFNVSPLYTEQSITPDTYHIQLYWLDHATGIRGVLTNQTNTLSAGQILRLYD